MKTIAYSTIALAASLGMAIYVAQPRPAAAQASACTFPTSNSATPEETAWRLFVAANCPIPGSSQVVWEKWIEQLQLYPASGTAAATAAAGPPKRLHGSPLAIAEISRKKGVRPQLAPNTECGTMQGPPPNVIAQTICEEVHLNPDAANFVTTNGYQIRPGQSAAAQKGTDIEFPTSAVEVKVDWVPASDFKSQFTCTPGPKALKGVHVEMIDGVCYAMAGIHISSKLMKNWLWATFEPQSMVTNPLRCITFGSCNDPWGSTPARSTGGQKGFTKPTQALQALMKQAGLAPEFLNYRLVGVQTEFTTSKGTPTYLGNSVIEGENVGMTKNTASCITCHSISSVSGNGSDGFGIFIKIPPQVGPQYKTPQGFIARDFVWSMGLACPTPPNGPAVQTCQ